MKQDVVANETDPQPGIAQIEPVMVGGHRICKSPSIGELRERAAMSVTQLPGRLRQLDVSAPYPVEIAPLLRRLAQTVDDLQESHQSPLPISTK